MAFDVYFYSDHALLWSVRYTLHTFPSDDDHPSAFLPAGAACILSCSAALEAIVNDLIQKQNKVSHWDELRLASKIDTLAELEGRKIDWGSLPWQDVSRLISVRNWLAHYKDPYVGLSGADDMWISDAINKRPRIDPEKELTRDSVRRFYDSVRAGGLQLSRMISEEGGYTHLETEEYHPLIS